MSKKTPKTLKLMNINEDNHTNYKFINFTYKKLNCINKNNYWNNNYNLIVIFWLI